MFFGSTDSCICNGCNRFREWVVWQRPELHECSAREGRELDGRIPLLLAVGVSKEGSFSFPTSKLSVLSNLKRLQLSR